MSKYTHTFYEQGNGFPEDGEIVVYDDDGHVTLLRIIDSSLIHTTGNGRGNYIYLTCEPALPNWDDLSCAAQDHLYENGFHVGSVDTVDE